MGSASLVPKLQLGNAMAGKAPALSRGSGASCGIYVPKLELGNEIITVWGGTKAKKCRMLNGGRGEGEYKIRPYRDTSSVGANTRSFRIKEATRRVSKTCFSFLVPKLQLGNAWLAKLQL
jgi:hypothetical protein